ncbi:MAG: fatty acid desaturase family protein [Rhodovibrionaceae bacterium]
MQEEVHKSAAVPYAELKALSEPSDRAGLLHLLGHFCLILATAALIWLSREEIWLLLPAMLLHGVAITFLFAPLHETIHRTAFRSKGLNDAVAWFAGAVLLLPPVYFRYFHFAHHRHTQDPARDPEIATPRPATWRGYLLHVSGLPYWIGYIRILLVHAFGRVSEPFVPKGRRGEIVAEARILLAVYLGIAAASAVLATDAALLYWVIPALLGQPFLRLYLLAEHGRCPLVRDMLANTRTTLTSGLVRFLAWNMPYHTEHHVYPALPFHRLPQAHALLKDKLRVTTPGYLAFHRDFTKGFSRGQSTEQSA